MPDFDPKIYERDIYQETVYSAWLKYSNERNVLEKFLRDNFRSLFAKKKLSIIDIGCGSGSAAQRLIKVLDENDVNFEYTGIDPYRDQLDRFKEWAGDRVTLIPSKIENFEASEHYDFAYLIHPLYYTDSIAEVLKKVFSFANSALIVHHGERGINEVHEAFRKYTKEGPNIISTYTNVKEALEELEIPFELQVVDTKVDVSACKDPHNPDGQKLIKFFLERSVLPDTIINEVSEWFKSRPNIMIHNAGYFLIK